MSGASSGVEAHPPMLGNKRKSASETKVEGKRIKILLQGINVCDVTCREVFGFPFVNSELVTWVAESVKAQSWLKLSLLR
jgi:hypothetical protein